VGSYQRRLAPGEIIFDQGDPGDQLYVIQSGEVELVREARHGQRVVARLGAGDFFGELGVVAGGNRTMRAVAVNTTRVIALDRATLEAMCLDQPAIAIRMIRVLVSRLVEAERRLALLGVDDLLRPIARALLRHAEPRSQHGVRVVATLKGLATSAGLSMLEAHRGLHELLERKLVLLGDDTLSIPDRQALNALLEAD
jgi:CRP/FNR family cyclic AMP-dependent transcriptional regulator